ncbi:glycerol-3-phosphate 1-O-acyltransferase PlsY [Thermodesulfobacteriota bacterium]
MWPYSILIPIASFFIGSIPFGALISQRVAKIDITRKGSGNIGATNVARELGLKWGLVTLALDLLKGFTPTYIFSHYFNAYNETGLFIVCLAILLGHQYSPLQKFRGGKGVATALGIFLAISPVLALIALLIFVVTVYASDFVSLGSMIAACAMPLSLLLHRKSDHLVVASLIMAALICLKHRDNIRRLLSGEERRWRKRPVM